MRPVSVAAAFLRAGEEGMLDGVEDQRGGHRRRRSPADDPAAERVDDERHVDEPHPGRHIRKVGHPQSIWGWCAEVAVDPIRVT
jgi:hypothetical protein